MKINSFDFIIAILLPVLLDLYAYLLETSTLVESVVFVVLAYIIITMLHHFYKNK
jgi:hypothetical protein